MENSIILKNLAQALADHIGENRVRFLDENEVILNNQLIKVKGNLVMGKTFSFRFFGKRNLLYSLRDFGAFAANDQEIKNIINRYTNLNKDHGTNKD